MNSFYLLQKDRIGDITTAPTSHIKLIYFIELQLIFIFLERARVTLDELVFVALVKSDCFDKL